jgi:hypothetical protein
MVSLVDASHLVNVILLVVVIYYCLQSSSFTLFHWHPILMTLSFGVLTQYGFSFIRSSQHTHQRQHASTEPLTASLLSSKRSHRIYLHVSAQLIAMSTAIVGGIVMWTNKSRFGQQHITSSWHALFGTIAIIWLIIQTLLGSLLYQPSTLPAATASATSTSRALHSKWRLTLRRLHSTSGIFMLIFGAIVLCLGFYTNWFSSKVSGPIWWFSLFAATATTAFTLTR